MVAVDHRKSIAVQRYLRVCQNAMWMHKCGDAGCKKTVTTAQVREKNPSNALTSVEGDLSMAVPSVDVNVEAPKMQLVGVKAPKVQSVCESAVGMPTPGAAFAPNGGQQVVASVSVNEQKRRVNLLQYS